MVEKQQREAAGVTDVEVDWMRAQALTDSSSMDVQVSELERICLIVWTLNASNESHPPIDVLASLS